MEAAKAWIALTNDVSEWPSPRHEQDLFDVTVDMVRGLHVRTLISLGPGSAEKDKKLAINLRIHEPWLEYIGVDISDSLLQNAMLQLTSIARIRIGILGDFEDRFAFIENQVNRHVRRPALLFLTGNTLGNIDGSEREFLNRIRLMMTGDDYLLFDVSVAGPKWTREIDPRANHAGYPNSYRTFFARGISLKTGEPIDTIVASFEERFEFAEGSSLSAGPTR